MPHSSTRHRVVSLEPPSRHIKYVHSGLLGYVLPIDALHRASDQTDIMHTGFGQRDFAPKVRRYTCCPLQDILTEVLVSLLMLLSRLNRGVTSIVLE